MYVVSKLGTGSELGGSPSLCKEAPPGSENRKPLAREDGWAVPGSPRSLWRIIWGK